jgi:hypothetical protein
VGKGLEIFLIMAGAVVLLVALLIGGFAWWLSSNKCGPLAPPVVPWTDRQG